MGALGVEEREERVKIETIGYAASDAEKRIAEFLKQEGAALVDIRKMPRSRYYWKFNEQHLRGLYPGQYIHIPQLGNVNYKPEDRAKGIQIADPEPGVKHVAYLLEQGHPIMLMCACKNYENCHRKVVYELVMAALKERDLKKGARVRIRMGDETAHLGTVYNVAWGRPAPYHVRPDGWPEGIPGIAYKSEELDVRL